MILWYLLIFPRIPSHCCLSKTQFVASSLSHQAGITAGGVSDTLGCLNYHKKASLQATGWCPRAMTQSKVNVAISSHHSWWRCSQCRQWIFLGWFVSPWSACGFWNRKHQSPTSQRLKEKPGISLMKTRFPMLPFLFGFPPGKSKKGGIQLLNFSYLLWRFLGVI